MGDALPRRLDRGLDAADRSPLARAGPHRRPDGATRDRERRPGHDRDASHAPIGAARASAGRAPSDLSDLDAWLDYKARRQRVALPVEAHLFYRRGLLAHRAGETDQATRLVRGAIELDPTFAAPRLTLASWSLMHEPGQALTQYAALVEVARQDFALQLTWAANAVYVLIQSLWLGIFATALHPARDAQRGAPPRLAGAPRPRTLPAGAAAVWPWVFLVAPFVVGLGLALPTVALLGLLWPTLKLRSG